jgi:hypothetical protein
MNKKIKLEITEDMRNLLAGLMLAMDMADGFQYVKDCNGVPKYRVSMSLGGAGGVRTSIFAETPCELLEPVGKWLKINKKYLK